MARMGAAAILTTWRRRGARLELVARRAAPGPPERPRAPVARRRDRAVVGGKGGFGQLLRNLGRAGGGVRTSAEIQI